MLGGIQNRSNIISNDKWMEKSSQMAKRKMSCTQMEVESINLSPVSDSK